MWQMLLPLAGNVLGGLFGNKSSRGAQNDANAGYDKAMGEWDEAWGDVRDMWSPYQQAGTDALSRQAAYLNGDDRSFMESGDYKFAVEQGQDSLNKLNAAQGNFFGGKSGIDTVLFGQNAAHRFGNDYWDKLMGRAQMGQNANSNLTQFRSNQAGSIADLLSTQGENNANARLARGRNTQDMIGGIGGFLGNLLGGS